MGKLRDIRIIGEHKDTVFTSTYAEVVRFYSDYKIEEWEEKGILAIKDTGSNVGLRDHSDVIIVYNKETGEPVVVTERIFRRNENWWSWRKHVHMALNQVKYEPTLLNVFTLQVSFGKDYIDYIYTKEEYAQCLRDVLVWH